MGILTAATKKSVVIANLKGIHKLMSCDNISAQRRHSAFKMLLSFAKREGGQYWRIVIRQRGVLPN